jgi:hypothetical protein
MSWTDFDDYEPEEAPQPGPRDDPSVQRLEPMLLAMFDANAEAVFYENQLCIHFERDFFHWVTSRALRDLREGNKVGSDLQELSGKTTLRLYFHRRNRYWRRRGIEIRKLVLEFSDPTFTNALGAQGELLVDAALPRIGFLPTADTVRSWNGITWNETNHDLDRVFVRDEVAYGTEIKNRLGYISKDEMEAKLRMCDALGLVPLFVARMMPKTYIDQVRLAGGFCWIMKYQFYPLAHRALAIKVRAELGLPVDCPLRLQDSTLQRFLNWHESKLGRLRARKAV